MEDVKSLLDRLFVPAKDSAINPFFEDFRDEIISNVSDRSKVRGRTYANTSSDSLVSRCVEHADKYNRSIDGSEIIFTITHPSYIFLTNGNDLNAVQLEDAEMFKENMIRFFSNSGFINAKKVLFETAHHYAYTSSLLEYGLVDHVIFTGYDNGIPESDKFLGNLASVPEVSNSEFMMSLADKTIISFGMYNGIMGGGCHSSALSSIMENVNSRKQVYAIKDLILDHPKTTTGSLKPSKIWYDDDYLNPEQVLSMDEIFRHI